MITLTETDNDKTISAQKDEKIVVILIWKPSSGFFWQEGGTTACTLESVKHEGEDPTPGADVKVTFTFKMVKTGQIVLFCARPWSETESPAKWFQVSVNLIH